MKFEDRYKYNIKTDLLGKGGFARVYKAHDTLLDREVAVKVFNPSDNEHYTVLEEIKKVIKFEHPNLLRYYDVAILENTNVFGEKEQLQVGIMEIANAGDLKTFIKKRPTDEQLSDLLQQVLRGLGYLHSKGIVHRDLKPQNILLQNKNGKLMAKLSDFGISKDMDSNTNSASMTIGTIEYMAPEQFSPNKYGIDGKIATNVDLWSFGIMVYELVVNIPPFGQRSGNTTAEQIMSSILIAELPKEIDTLREPFKTIVKKCLVSNANDRVKKAEELLPLFANTSSPNTENLRDDRDTETQVFDFIEKPVDNQETAIFETNSDETQIFENGNQGEQRVENENIRSNKKLIWGGLGVLLLGIIAFVGVKFFNKHEPKEIKSYEGLIIEKKYTEALPIIQKLAEENDPKAQFELGFLYNKGFGVKQNYQEALKYYQKAVAQNNADAQAFLGDMYAEGLGVKQDFNEAIKLYVKSSEQNNSYGQNNLGVIYQNGLGGFKQDYNQALKFYTLSAKQNNPWGQVDLGNMYLDGLGIEKDVNKALELFKKSAEQNDATGQDALGNLYVKGLGIKQDYQAAFQWFKKSAEQNFANAQNNLGWMYYNGFGVSKDIKESTIWFKKAAKQGNRDAQKSLKNLNETWE
jgi:TPR repeat protein/tRNA A-37 threonylcarbamoyl transferase component Bud32